MNERIKQLAEQAGFETDRGPLLVPGPYIRVGGGLCVGVPLEKFAELIVRECMDKVDKAGSAFNEQPQYNDKQNALVSEGFFWALESVKQQVKEHFGVEE
jgi:hypothetical protein